MQSDDKLKEVETMQQEIIRLYRTQFCKTQHLVNTKHYNLSMPHIPRVSERYLETRVVIVGQETNFWNPLGDREKGYSAFLAANNEKEIEKLTLEDCHDWFIKNWIAPGAPYKYPGMFWKFHGELYEQSILRKPMVVSDHLSHAWINLFVMEDIKVKSDSNSMPSKNKALGECVLKLQEKLIFDVLRVLEPELILFLTGGALDHIVGEYALNLPKGTVLPGQSIDTLGIFNKYEILDVTLNITHPLYKANNRARTETKILRLYHPDYFMWRINDKRLRFYAAAQQKAGKTAVEHYQDIVWNYLKEWSGSNLR